MSLSPLEQNKILRELSQGGEAGFPAFAEKLNGRPLRLTGLDTLQLNVGKLCNQSCKHCHVDAGPNRKEVMSRETMQACLRALDLHPFKVVDITGGAPEMVPDFRWLVDEVHRRKRHIISRCNLTIIEANSKFHDLPEFYAKHGVEVVSSLPSFAESTTDRQRGTGVFAKSISALKKLNAVGYGIQPELKLNLVYNPNGAFLPGSQADLEADFRQRLLEDHGIQFHSLYTITNMPISRFLEYLIDSNNFKPYMRKLIDAYNPSAIQGLMCRSMISVSWDGYIYDCDFNQMLDLKVSPAQHISEFDAKTMMSRNIVLGNHCYGCTAGSGSSCGGTLIN